MKRQIWFRKILWSYVPVHWKGVAAMAAIILPTVLAILAAPRILESIGVSGADGWPFLLLPLAVIAGWVVAERHSERAS